MKFCVVGTMCCDALYWDTLWCKTLCYDNMYCETLRSSPCDVIPFAVTPCLNILCPDILCCDTCDMSPSVVTALLYPVL